jgi:hypothetical protein
MMQQEKMKEKRATTKRTRTKDKTGEEEKNEATIRFLRERTKLRTEYRGLINEVGGTLLQLNLSISRRRN